MEEIQALKDQLEKLRQQPGQDLKKMTAMYQLEVMISERERKLKQSA